jgi:hypothetical protein
MPRTDADKQKIIEQLTAAAKPAGNGTLYIRACVACKIIGVKTLQGSAWQRLGKIKAIKCRVSVTRITPFGKATFWPLDQAIACARQYMELAYHPWTEAEDEELLASLGVNSIKEIAAKLGRSPMAVKQRGYRLGVTMHNNAGKLTVGQVAGLCRRSRNAVRVWCTRRGLKHTRLLDAGGAYMIDPADLLTFIDAHPKIGEHLPEAARRTIKRMAFKPATPSKKTKPAPDPGPRVYRRCA